MKKCLTLRNILVLIGALLTVVAFGVAFSAGMSGTMSVMGIEAQSSITGIIIGTQKSVTTALGQTHVEVSKDSAHAGLSLAGIIMMLVAGLAAVGLCFVKKPWTKWVILGCAVVILVGAIFVFAVKDSYINSSVAKEIKDGHLQPSEKEDAIKELKTMFESLKVNAGAIITGILGCLSAVVIAVSQFVKQKA